MRATTKRLLKATVIGFLTTTLAGVARAEIVTFETIAVTGDPIPDGGGAIYDRFFTPTISDGTVVFAGGEQVPAGEPRVLGIYTSSGGTVSSLVDSNTAVPGGTGTFTQLSGYSVSGGTVYFTGDGSDPQSGAYSVPVTGGTITTIANQNTPVPDGATFDSFDTFISTGANGETVAIEAFLGPLREGIYTHNGGTFTTVVNPDTQIPGTTDNFRQLSAPDVAADGTVVFRGQHDQAVGSFQGIYTGDGGALTTIVDSNTAVPNSTGTFEQIRLPAISDSGTVAFGATGTETLSLGQTFSGIYTSANGVLSVVADATTLTPDGTEFALFDLTLTPIWEDTVAFIGYDLLDADTLRRALWISRAGTLYEILTITTQTFSTGTVVGETFDGKTLSSIFLNQNAIEGDTIAFQAAFTDGTFGIYTASIEPTAVPEPSSLLLLGLTGVGFAGVCWRRRKPGRQTTLPA